MAISPNVDFVAGAILTATQQNQFPRGVMSFTKNIAVDSSITSEETQITGNAFVAVANRNYRVTYYEPYLYGAVSSYIAKIKNGATVLNEGTSYGETLGYPTGVSCVFVGTFTAGTVNLTATLQATAGTGTADRNATRFAFLLVEDIGPA